MSFDIDHPPAGDAHQYIEDILETPPEMLHLTHNRQLVRAGVIGLLVVSTVVLAACTNSNTLSEGGPSATLPTLQDGSVNLLAGEWQYLPGATVESDGLHIQSHDLKIVEQDGSGGQPNPPVNEYGTHLNVSGGFATSATLRSIIGPASIQLYGSPPPTSDEFRVETPSIQVTINGHTISVKEWNGAATHDLADQQPAITYPTPGSNQDDSIPQMSSGTDELTVSDQQGKVTIDVNGKSIATVPDEGVFNNKQVWYGFDAGGSSGTGSFTVAELSAKPLDGGTIAPYNTAAAFNVRKYADGLQALANKKRPGFLVGSDVALWALTSSSTYRNEVYGNFGIVTPENAMKWQFIEPEPGVYDFHEADAVVNDALKNGVQVHGHNLVFSEALPQWVQTLPTDTPEQKAYVQQVLYDHVYATVKHFNGRVNEWDINELFADNDNSGNIPNNGFTNNVFYRALGENYVKVVCDAAVAANPKVKLWVNDFGAETDTGNRWQFMFNTIKKWKDEWKLPLYGFGFESHIYNTNVPSQDDEVGPNGDAATFNQHMNDFGGIGMRVRVSEADAPLDSSMYNGSSQAQQLSGVLQLCLNNPNCVAFSIWSNGMTDLSQSSSYALDAGEVDSPFDQQNRPVQPTYRDMQTVLR